MNSTGLNPWLIAAWPGMGNVALIAAGYLISKLGMEPIDEVAPQDFFDLEQVRVQGGRIAQPRLPRTVFYRWRNPQGRDLIVLLGEAQPSSGSFALARQILDKAAQLGVERVITFASMAGPIHPSSSPRAFGAATGDAALIDLHRVGVEPLEDGQIGGMNGILLGVAVERDIPGLCLLGEIPLFAAGVPNPKAARAVLSNFAVLAGIDVSMQELDQHARHVEDALLELLGQLRAREAEGGRVPPLPDDPSDGRVDAADDGDEEPIDEAPVQAEAPPAEPMPAPKPISPAMRGRIEALFEAARQDRSRAVKLKSRLDRLGIYPEYEDRFLDLFRRED